MIKWPITDYYAKKLPNGQAFPLMSRKNPGSGEYEPDPGKLNRLEDDHGENMVPLQKVAVFILRFIPEKDKRSGCKALTYHYDALVKSNDKRIAEVTAKHGDIRRYTK